MGGTVTEPTTSREEALPLTELTLERAVAFGEEARALARLLGASVRAFDGTILVARLEARDALHAALTTRLVPGRRLAIRPLHPTAAAARAYDAHVGARHALSSEADVATYVRTLCDAAQASELRTALSGSRSLPLRLVPVDDDVQGIGDSLDPIDGNPERVGVALEGRPVYRVDRKSGRVEIEGEGLDPHWVEDVADLVDRCQLALGRPVRIEWARAGGRPRILSIALTGPRFEFADLPLRRVALVAADEGTVTPLATDALDRGLSDETRLPRGTCAQRVYARPYRRLPTEGRLLGGAAGSVPAATSAAAKVAYEAAMAARVDADFVRATADEVMKLRFSDFDELDDERLLDALDTRHALVAQAFARLDRCRELTRRAVAALEIAVGPLPREVYPALSAPKHTRERARVAADLAELARRIGTDLGEPDVRARLDSALERRFEELRRQLVDVRPLGIDLADDALGSSDAALVAALRAAPTRRRVDALEDARSLALRRVLAVAQDQPLAAARAGVVSSVGLVLDRIVTSKGRLAEALAGALSELRRVALAVGHRLVRTDIVERPDDAFYLTQAELTDALSGEPTGLAARVRARREDDTRWRSFDAPRRLCDEPR